MSVNISEEYLDELLQAIEPIIYMNEPIPESKMTGNVIEDNIRDSLVEQSDNQIEIAVSEPVENTAENIVNENLQEQSQIQSEEVISEVTEMESFTEDVTMDSLLAALTSEEASEISEISEDALLENRTDVEIDAVVNMDKQNDTVNQETSDHDEDVKELLKQFTDDEDLTDINEILEKHDNSEAIEEALLQQPEVEVFRLESEETEGTEEAAEEDEGEKKSGGIFSFFKKSNKKKNEKKNRRNKAEVESDVQEDTSDVDVISAVTDNLVTVEETDLLTGLDAGVLGGAPRGNIEIEIDNSEMYKAQDTLESGQDALLSDGDMSDIEQLLTGGAFDEIIPLKRENSQDDSKKKKKESFFSRFLNMLMEEDEEEESKKETKKGNVPEADSTGVTDENIAILDELSKEDKKRAKAEKKEQRKKEKEARKKGKSVDATEGEDEESEVDAKKKNKKPKKPKVRKVQEISDKPQKKLTRKKVSAVFAFCFSILAMILILQMALLYYSNRKAARWAFDNEDYETCYVNLYGEKLSKEDQLIFDKSYIILCVQRKLDAYENFIALDMGVEALNSLFEGVRVYRDIEEQAEEFNVLDRIYGTYQTIWEKLYDYGLSDSDVEEILNYESNVTYTKHLEAIVNGTTFEAENFLPVESEEVLEEDADSKPLEDVLPQEEDFLPDDTGL